MTTTAVPKPVIADAIENAIAERSFAVEEARHATIVAQQAFADEVRRMVAAGEASVAEVAKRAGISRAAMYEVLRRYPAQDGAR